MEKGNIRVEAVELTLDQIQSCLRDLTDVLDKHDFYAGAVCMQLMIEQAGIAKIEGIEMPGLDEDLRDTVLRQFREQQEED